MLMGQNALQSDLPKAKLCEERTVIGLASELKYSNDSDANIDSEMWFHHVVVMRQ